MDSEPLSTRRRLISNATLRRMSGTRDPFWTVGRCLMVIGMVVFCSLAIALAI